MNLRVGRIGRLFAPGYSECGRCHTPWLFVQHHSTMYCSHDPVRMVQRFLPDGSLSAPVIDACCGAFPLCEKCWRDLGTPAERRPFYKRLIARWKEQGFDDPLAEARLLEAVDNE